MMKKFKTVRVVEALPWLNSSQGFELTNDWDHWVASVVAKGAEEYHPRPHRRTGIKHYLFSDSARELGMGAFDPDRETVYGFWYGETQTGVILDKPARSTDPFAGNFVGLPPGFTNDGLLLTMVGESLDEYPLETPTKSINQIAKDSGVSLDSLKAELALGIEVESEHTPHNYTATEIALDHLAEDPSYYSKLKAAGIKGE